MDSVVFPTVQWLSLYLLIFFAPISPSSSYKIPRLSPLLDTILRDPSENASKSITVDYETFFYDQTLDHFNYKPESYATFQQRYFVNFKYWGGAKERSPILVYLGAEAPIDGDPESIGFLTEIASRFKSLLVYIEHRFYGKSVPFVTFEEAVKNKTLRGYFSSAQAIADYAEVLLFIKQNLSASQSPIIVVGGSYGGMLASWFRLKYPHIAIGALASSAPILYFDDITPENGYYSIVTKDFKEVSENCYETIRQSWSEIDKVASEPQGLSILSQKFKTCGHLNNSMELKDFLESMYSVAAQYNSPPKYPVTEVCAGIDGAPQGTDILGRIFAGVVSYQGNQSCYDTNRYNQPTQTNIGYRWQTCSEMVMPIGRGENDTMFPPAAFSLSEFIEDCKRRYGVTPRPHWVTTYYGGHDIKRVLHNFASNIIFSNGLRDPYSSAGVLEDISKTVVAIATVNGSHCLDILTSNKTDPQWLIEQRKKEVEIIQGWIAKYYGDLLLFGQ